MTNCSSSSIEKFNRIIVDFVEDLKKFNNNDKDIIKIEIFLASIKIKKELVIRYFQIHVLKDIIVKKLFEQDVDFFINYDFFSEDKKLNNMKNTNYLKGLFDRVKNTLVIMKNSTNGEKNIKNIFEWLYMMVYYSYEDLGISCEEKIKYLKSNNENYLS